MERDLTEQVTGELKRLVAYGATWRRVATCQALREVAGVSHIYDYREAGQKIMDFIIRSIRSLEGQHSFHGYCLDPHDLKLGLRLLLKLEWRYLRDPSAPGRRAATINKLKLSGHTPQGWRRDPSPERDLLRILAEAMCSGYIDNLSNRLSA